MTERRVHLSPRLQAACDMLSDSVCVADIGCDHGRLSAALLQTGACSRVIATDVSEPSLQKARRLAAITGLTERISFRAGDGLSVLTNGECDAVGILGMGGTLMARLIKAADVRALGISRLILQPMRAFSDIRSYLHENGFCITDDRIVCDNGRMYQIFAASPTDSVQQVPEAWPSAFFELGFVSWARRDENLPALANKMLIETRRRLRTALGSEGEAKLREKERALVMILEEMEKMR